MKTTYFFAQHFSLFLALAFFIACNGQEETNLPEENADTPKLGPEIIGPLPKFHFGTYEYDTTLVSQYIRGIFQDSKGNYWFGSAGQTVARYDGRTLKYFSVDEFFQDNDKALEEDNYGHSVHAITEDEEGNLWFGTFDGLVKYDGKTFKSYTEKHGLSNIRVGRQSVVEDKSGDIWVGTEGGGVFRYIPSADTVGGQCFSQFKLLPPFIAKGIMEDSSGNIWFASKEKGVFRYDPSASHRTGSKAITNLKEKKGLGNSYGYGMAQDKDGNYWFSMEGGICRYDGKTFTSFTTKDGIAGIGSEIWGLAIEDSGIIWITARGSTTRFDPSLSISNPNAIRVFTPEEDGINCCVQSMYQDRLGNMWWGTGQGLYRFDGEQFYQVKQQGPWPNLQLGSKTGLKIEYGPNLGMIGEFTAGNYIHITAMITNDSTIPINLQMALSNEYDFPDSCGESKYKIFLLPKELTPDTATLYNNITNTVTDETDDFLERCLENPYFLNRILQPNEYTVITIGALFPRNTQCAALPRAIFAENDRHNFQRCDNRISEDKSTNPQFALGVKIDFYSGKGSTPETCLLHSCGQISYPKH